MKKKKSNLKNMNDNIKEVVTPLNKKENVINDLNSAIKIISNGYELTFLEQIELINSLSPIIQTTKNYLEKLTKTSMNNITIHDDIIYSYQMITNFINEIGSNKKQSHPFIKSITFKNNNYINAIIIISKKCNKKKQKFNIFNKIKQMIINIFNNFGDKKNE